MNLSFFSDNEIREEFKRRYAIPNGINIDSSHSVADHLISYATCFTEDVEHFMVVFLTSSNKLIKTEVLSVGTIDRAVIFPREIIKKVLQHNAAAVILSHNHPSGNLTPSKADINITQKIQTALSSIDARLLDHIIITKTDYSSFSDLGHI